jgi:thiamine biosynthesis protein ThiS
LREEWDAIPKSGTAGRERQGKTAMLIQLNGKPREVETGITVGRLLEELNIHPQRVAVQVNRDIVKREGYEGAVLGPGDEIEILTFMAGG